MKSQHFNLNISCETRSKQSPTFPNHKEVFCRNQAKNTIRVWQFTCFPRNYFCLMKHNFFNSFTSSRQLTPTTTQILKCLASWPPPKQHILVRSLCCLLHKVLFVSSQPVYGCFLVSAAKVKSIVQGSGLGWEAQSPRVKAVVTLATMSQAKCMTLCCSNPLVLSLQLVNDV